MVMFLVSFFFFPFTFCSEIHNHEDEEDQIWQEIDQEIWNTEFLLALYDSDFDLCRDLINRGVYQQVRVHLYDRKKIIVNRFLVLHTIS